MQSSTSTKESHQTTSSIETTYFDVLIVGAGLSGIGAAHYIQKECSDKSYAILEMRPQMGGTWDLFKYPGIRSDSDMYTLGYAFRPWKEAKAIAGKKSSEIEAILGHPPRSAMVHRDDQALAETTKATV